MFETTNQIYNLYTIYYSLSSQGNRAPYFEPDYVQSENIH